MEARVVGTLSRWAVVVKKKKNWVRRYFNFGVVTGVDGYYVSILIVSVLVKKVKERS